MSELETRELRYFLAVAEELHVGRAAQRLGIAQPALSRAVQRLERRLGVALLERHGRRIALAAAGAVLRDEARAVLEHLDAAAERTRRAGTPALQVVVKPGGDGGLLTGVLAAYEADPDATPVELLMCAMDEHAGLLRAGRGDVALLHVTEQTDRDGLDTQELRTEGCVAVLPGTHPLAGRSALHLADLSDAGAQVLRGAAAMPVREGGQLLQLVALGRAVVVVPESVRVNLPRGLVAVPVLDAAPVALHVAWPAATTSRAVAAFVRAAVAVAEGPAPVAAQRSSQVAPACRCVRSGT